MRFRAHEAQYVPLGRACIEGEPAYERRQRLVRFVSKFRDRQELCNRRFGSGFDGGGTSADRV